MPLDLTKLPPGALRDVREFVRENRLYSRPSTGLLTDSKIAEHVDAHIASLDPEEFFDHFLTWNGIVNWTATILNAIDGARAAKK